jgi:signal transduction histidine kinase/DNA-binding response OmpR family regulator
MRRLFSLGKRTGTMKHLSIKLQLTLSAIALGMALLLAQLVLQFQVLRSDIVHRIEKNEFRQLTEFAKNLDDRLEDSVAMLSSVGMNLPAEDMTDLRKLEKLLQREHALLNVYDDLYIFDLKGVLLVDWPVKTGRRSLDMSSRDYIQGVLRTHEPVISKPILGKATKQPIVVVAVPILDKNNHMIGIMGGVLNLYKPNLLGAIAAKKNGQDGYYFLVTKDRMRIAHPDPSLVFKVVPERSSNLPFENALQGFEGTQEGFNTRGLKALFTFKRMEITDWIVGSVIPSSEAFSPIDDLYQRMLIVTALLMLVIIPLLWGFVAKLVSPLGQLAQAMHDKAMQMRDGKDATPIDEIGGKEIKTVVHAFNEFMVARLKAEKDLSIARDAAQAANESKSNFLANMSHEIRTPMNGILGMTELCLQTQMTEEQRSYLEMVSVSANSLLVVINDILDFSKIEARKLYLDPHEFSLHGLIRQATRTLSLRASEKELELVCDIAADVPDRVVGDPLRLQQVISNLLGNAIKFTAQGEIMLTVENMPSAPTSEGVWLVVRIKDTGIGISQDKQAMIFDVFTQADSSTARRYGGSGLGLAISRSLVEMMGGEIQVDSQMGKGSTFTFTTHLQKVNLAAVSNPQLQPELQGKTVLVVDDVASSRRVLANRLTSIGLHPVVCDGAAQTMHSPQLAQAKLALIDANMPDIDGYALVAQLRNLYSSQQLPIILVGALSEQISQEQLTQLDIQGFLIKPIDVAELITLCNRLLSHSTVPQRVGHTLSSEQELPHVSRPVLLVEDMPINQTLQSILLTRMGYEVTLANNGVEGLDAFMNAEFDFILMDIQMPEMGGIEATQRIRELEQTRYMKRTPIIAVTANALVGDRELYFGAGMDGYVSKPLTLEALKMEIQTVLAHAKLKELAC